jgi:ABC-type multidrug transport system ATPase subunit
MDEASLCDRIALIQKGKFLSIDTPQNIVNQYKNQLWAVRSTNMSKLLSDLRRNKSFENCFAFGDSHHLSVNSLQFTVSDKHIIMNSLKDYLLKYGHTDIEIIEIQPTIEDCFMEISRDTTLFVS